MKEKNRPKVLNVYSQPMERLSSYRSKRCDRTCIHIWYVLLQFGPSTEPVRMRISEKTARWLMKPKRLGLKDI